MDSVTHRAAPGASAAVLPASVGLHHADCDDESRVPTYFASFACFPASCEIDRPNQSNYSLDMSCVMIFCSSKRSLISIYLSHSYDVIITATTHP